MAFFKNFSQDAVSQGVLEDKGQGQNPDRIRRSVDDECAYATSSEKEFDMNMEAQYESDSELDGASRLQKEATADDRVATIESNAENMDSKTATVGRWGTTFWKDCQPMCPQNGSESGHESKSGSDYRNADESDDNLSDGRVERLNLEDDDGQKDSGKGPRGHSDISAEEMLSDEYYEQDGEEQSDSLHYRGFHQPTISDSWSKRMSTIANRHVRKSRISDDAEDNDDDADYAEEDEVDEDDPDDADFEPSTSDRAANKGQGQLQWKQNFHCKELDETKVCTGAEEEMEVGKVLSVQGKRILLVYLPFVPSKRTSCES
ncbi:hypothetical protein VNO77_42836 [Canavalia gladiata]|uniref:Uncharacterized protein n=1 Tax=Canavalia gladiata TaxID=3824 RepID=A0AAN9JW02_CANGL